MSVDCSDGEPVAYYRETPRVARKGHACCACEIPILPGHRYWVIAACWDGRVHTWKRCARCQLIHEQLRPLCAPHNEWPDEELNCGHTFEENYDRPPPEWMAALAFWKPGDPLPHVNACTPSLRHDYVRALVYRTPPSREAECRPKPNAWGIEGPRENNPKHQVPCS